MKTRYNSQLDVLRDEVLLQEEKVRKMEEKIEKEKIEVKNTQKLFKKIIKE